MHTTFRSCHTQGLCWFLLLAQHYTQHVYKNESVSMILKAEYGPYPIDLDLLCYSWPYSRQGLVGSLGGHPGHRSKAEGAALHSSVLSKVFCQALLDVSSMAAGLEAAKDAGERSTACSITPPWGVTEH